MLDSETIPHNFGFSSMSRLASDTLQRPRSSKLAAYMTSKHSIRPKSTPNKVERGGVSITTCLPPRPSTAFESLASRRSGCDQCDRLISLCEEPVRRHNFPQSHSIKKLGKKSIDSEDSARSIHIGPGYVMSRGNSKISMNIDADNFFAPRTNSRDEAMKRAAYDIKDILAQKLQEEISNLQLHLEEERLNHKLTSERLTKEMTDAVAELIQKHSTESEEKEANFSRILEEREENHQNDLKCQRNEYDQQIEKLQQEVEFLESSFEVYKSSIAQDYQRQADEREIVIRRILNEEKEKEIAELKENWDAQKTIEMKIMEQDQKRFIEDMKKDHKRDLEELARRYTDVQETIDRLKMAEIELQECHAAIEALNDETSSLQELNSNLRDDLMTTQMELDKTRNHLEDFIRQFDDKVRKVDDQYRQKIDGLKKQAVDLRRAYLSKCGQLVEEKVKCDLDLMDRVQNAKDTMRHIIQTRLRTELSMAALTDTESAKPRHLYSRPLSAPITDVEVDWAQCSAGETQSQITPRQNP